MQVWSSNQWDAAQCANLVFSVDLKRTRDPAVLNTCDIVVDVGGVYDEKTQRFDHHQRGFEEIFGHGFSTKLSSAGLVYKYASDMFPGVIPAWC